MPLIFWAITASVFGKLLLGLAVVLVHWRVVKEHKIDKKVITEMRRERNIAIVGILLILLGYVLELAHYDVISF